MLEVELSKHFTDLDNRFDARLSAVLAVRRTEVSAETTGFSAKYECRVKAQYQRDLMGLLEEGMLIAVRNFKAKKHDNKRFTLLEISRIGPEHFGLRGLSDTSYYPYQFEIIEQSMSDWDTDDKATMMIQISAIPLNYDLIINEQRASIRERIHVPNCWRTRLHPQQEHDTQNVQSPTTPRVGLALGRQ